MVTFSKASERIRMAWRYAGVAAVTNMLASGRLSEGMSLREEGERKTKNSWPL
jgi:hypothetical protein